MFWYRLFRKSDDGTYVQPKAGLALVPSTVAENQTLPGTRVCFMIEVPTSGSNGNTDIIMPFKVRVLDAYVIQQAATVATETAQVFNGANAISSTMALSGAITTVARATTINSAYWEVAAGGTLRVTTATGASQPQFLCVVEGMLV